MAACCCCPAQTAQLEGKEEVAHLKFRQMLDRRDAEFVGLRGLLAQAMKTGEYDEALTLARRAYRRSPTTPWVLTTLFELLARSEKWDEALPLVDEMQAQKLLDDGQAAPQAQRHASHDGDPAAPGGSPRRRAGAGAGGQGGARFRARRRCRRPSWRLQRESPPARAAAARGRLARRAAPRHRPGLRPARPERDAEPAAEADRQPAGAARQSGHRDAGAAGRAGDAGRRLGHGPQPARGGAEADGRRHASIDCWPSWSASRGGDAAKAQEWLARATDAEPDRAWVCDDTGEVLPSLAALRAQRPLRRGALDHAARLATMVGGEQTTYILPRDEVAAPMTDAIKPAAAA